jgi:hypothetical protein
VCGCKHVLKVATSGLRYSCASIGTRGGYAHSPSKFVSVGEVVCWVGNSGEKGLGLFWAML